MLYKTRSLRPSQRHTVISTLLHLRYQYQRTGGSGGSGSLASYKPVGDAVSSRNNAKTSSEHTAHHRPSTRLGTSIAAHHLTHANIANPTMSPSTATALCAEALRLLNKENRRQDFLSEVHPSSAGFCVEVGKLMAVGVFFGASTTTGRIKEGLQWAVDNKSRLETPRQLMSLCMPLLNLQDGKTHGKDLFFKEFYGPLVTALQRSHDAHKSSAGLGQSGAPTERPPQHRAAIISVFQLNTKLVEVLFSSPQGPAVLDKDENKGPSRVAILEKLCCLQEAAVRAVIGAHHSTAHSYEPLEAVECLHIIRSFHILHCACNTVGSGQLPGGHPDAQDLCRQLGEMYVCVRPVLDAALGCPAPTASFKTMDVCHLLTAGVNFYDAAQAAHLLQMALQLLSRVIPSASVKDMTAVVQTVNKVRAAAPQLVNSAVLTALVEAMRPKLFRLAETHGVQLRHIECSILLSGMSRWEGVDGLVKLPDDLLYLLCSRFAAQLPHAQATHLIPLLQGLARVEASRHRAPITNEEGVLVQTLAVVEELLEKCSDHAIALARSGQLTATEAAQILLAFAHLRSMTCIGFFEAVEPTLQLSHATAAEAISSSCSLLHAFGAMKRFVVAATPAQRGTMTRVATQHRRLWLSMLAGVVEVQTAKELVMLFSVLCGSGTGGKWLPGAPADAAVQHESLELELAHDNADTSVVTSEKNQKGRATTDLFERFVKRVDELSGACNAYEVGALSMAIALLHTRHQLSPVSTHAAMRSLLKRCACVELTLADAKKILDALRMVKYPERVPSVVLTAARLALQQPPSLQSAAVTLHGAVALGQTLLAYANHQMNGAVVATLQSGGPLTQEDTMLPVVEAYMRHVQSFVKREATVPDRGALHGVVALAFIVAQLWKATAKAGSGIATEAASDIEDDADEREGEQEVPYEASPLLSGVAADAPGEYTADAESRRAVHQHALHAAVKETMQVFGDVVSAALEQLPEINQSDVWEGDGVAPYGRQPSASLTGNTLPRLSSKELTMLVQSFEMTGVSHHNLLYNLLAYLQTAAHAMTALELSIVVNALIKLGVWNARVLNCLAAAAATQIARCELRQCHAVLRGVQRSNFLSADLFLSPRAGVGQLADWGPSSLETVGDSADAVQQLAVSAVSRLDAIICVEEAELTEVLRRHTFEDFVSVVRALSFFSHPPQPTFDTYFVLAARKLMAEVRAQRHAAVACGRRQQRRRRRSAAADSTLTNNASLRNVVLGAITLISTVSHLRRYDHQTVTSRVLAASLRCLERTCGAQRVWRTVSEVKLAELVRASRAHLLLYDEDFLFNPSSQVARKGLRPSCSSCAEVVTPAVLSVLFEMLCGLDAGRRASLTTQVFQRLSHYTVPIPLAGAASCLPELMTSYVELLETGEQCPMSWQFRAQMCGCLNRCATALDTAGLLPRIGGCLAWLTDSIKTNTADLSLLSTLDLVALLHSYVIMYHVCRKHGEKQVDYGEKVISLAQGIEARGQYLSVRCAVDMLITCASTAFSDPALVVAARRLMVIAGRSLTAQMQTADTTGLRILPDVYRLLLGANCCFVKWALAQSESTKPTTPSTTESAAEVDVTASSCNGGVLDINPDDAISLSFNVVKRALLALVRSLENSEVNHSATLGSRCRAEIVVQVEGCVREMQPPPNVRAELTEVLECLKVH